MGLQRTAGYWDPYAAAISASGPFRTISTHFDPIGQECKSFVRVSTEFQQTQWKKYPLASMSLCNDFLLDDSACWAHNSGGASGPKSLVFRKQSVRSWWIIYHSYAQVFDSGSTSICHSWCMRMFDQLQRLLYPRAQLCWKRSRGLAKLQDGMTGPTSGAHKSRPSWHHSPCSITESLVIPAMDVLWLKTLESSHQHQLDLVRPSPEFWARHDPPNPSWILWSKACRLYKLDQNSRCLYWLLFADTCGPVTAWENDRKLSGELVGPLEACRFPDHLWCWEPEILAYSTNSTRCNIQIYSTWFNHI